MDENKEKKNLLKKALKKKMKKKLLAFMGISNFGLIVCAVVIFALFVMLVQNDTSEAPDISDIGAMGVPTEFVPYFNEASEIFNIPNWILAAVAKQESGFDPNASFGGAYGIMQIQKYDSATGEDLWRYLMDLGLGEIYKKNGYTFSNTEDMWNLYLKDSKVQIIAGSYEIRYYANYVLYKKGKTVNLNYNSNENMDLINWKADEDNQEFRELLRRTFACYNGGPYYGMNINLDSAQFDYPNKVFKYAMEFRSSGIDSNANEIVENAIKAGERWMGRPYLWGGGRTQYDVDNGIFDCSSFIHYMYASAGLQLGARESVVTFSLVNMGKAVPSSNMKRGDLIFFDTYTTNGHVGVYLGNGDFIHCGTSSGVTVSSLNSCYYKNVFNGTVRRVVDEK
ncbi:NlpC/P60 family protein [Clostridium sp. LP20]|uniref:C40 family peptidase n=1 Tax=Clostridium sp. LP20 TaxID=3418665 RepID=UPI003EE4D9A7